MNWLLLMLQILTDLLNNWIMMCLNQHTHMFNSRASAVGFSQNYLTEQQRTDAEPRTDAQEADPEIATFSKDCAWFTSDSKQQSD